MGLLLKIHHSEPICDALYCGVQLDKADGIISYDLLRSTVTNQIAFDQWYSNSIPTLNAGWTVVARRWFLDS